MCGLCRLQCCSVLQREMQTTPPRSSPLQTKWGFCRICQATVCGLVRIAVVLGSCIAALEKRLKDMAHNPWGLLDRTLSQAWQRIPVIPAPGRLGDCCECEASFSYIVSAEPSEPEQPCRTRPQSSECAIAESECSLEGRVGCFAATELSLFICGKYCNLCK